MNKSIQKASKIVGGQTALAEALSISQTRVWNWINRDKRVPIEFVPGICRATNFEVKPHEIRPDFFNEENFSPVSDSASL